MSAGSPVVRRTTTGSSHPLQAARGLWSQDEQLDPGPQQVPDGLPGLQQLALQVIKTTLLLACLH